MLFSYFLFCFPFKIIILTGVRWYLIACVFFFLHFHNVWIVLKNKFWFYHLFSLYIYSLFYLSLIFPSITSLVFILLFAFSKLDAVIELRTTDLKTLRWGQLFTQSLHPGKEHAAYKETAPFLRLLRTLKLQELLLTCFCGWQRQN